MDENDKLLLHVDAAEKRDGLPGFDQDAPCPTCGGVVETGFGLAGGGYGVYSFCPACAVVISKSPADEGSA